MKPVFLMGLGVSALTMSISAGTCGTSTTPSVSDIQFPAEVKGDSVSVQGQVGFSDSNAGVQYAMLDALACPSGWSCPSLSLDFAQIDPEMMNATLGSFSFGLSCDNRTANDAQLLYSWTLKDVEGNVSTPAEFSFICIGMNKDPRPSITALSFPATLSGTGTAGSGKMSFVDGNAGVTYAHLDNVTCPAGFTCPEATVNLTSSSSTIVNATSGTINFSLSCSNATSSSAYFAYTWTLEDVEGNLSNAWQFGFTCSPASQGRTRIPSQITVLEVDAQGRQESGVWLEGAVE